MHSILEDEQMLAEKDLMDGKGKKSRHRVKEVLFIRSHRLQVTKLPTQCLK